MFTRIRVVTSLLVVLVLFAALQLTSGSLFIRALHHDKTSFSASQLSAQNLAAITDAYMIRPAPEFAVTMSTEYLTGLGALGERMLILVDIEKLLSSEEMALMDTLRSV
ncbi:hypothetical protein CRX72_15645 [Pantoea sp. BRM17]|nr:hypothetical protein CRX72_15645 [Pantoea sp. BRM17]